ncbi:MAG: DUF4339 domain-containing protein [Muribaculaceae bacterium]|nr:DUF4339 domain-containing protein [Muribaculaceae bacterium]
MEQYYIAVNGQPEGPFSLEQLKHRGDLSPETLVWKPGMENWRPLSEFQELADVIEFPKENSAEERFWFAMINGERQVGPRTISELFEEGLDGDTPVWRGGMDNWFPAAQLPEFAPYFRMPPINKGSNRGFGETVTGTPPYNADQKPERTDFANNPQYNPHHNYNNRNTGYSNGSNETRYYYNEGRQFYDHGNYTPMRTNWLPWAIGATVVGFFFSCIGAIFGIIGIVQANKANSLYAMHRHGEARQADNNAKIMTIIGYVFAGLGILCLLFLKGFTNSLMNLSYL